MYLAKRRALQSEEISTARMRSLYGAYHDLVADRIARGEKSYTVFLGKCLDQLVFTEIGFALQLNLVVNREDRLRRVLDSCGVHRPVLVNQIL